jgi:hypothetical protein
MEGYEEYWKNEYKFLRTESKDLIAESPEGKDVIQHVLKTLSDIVSPASCTPTKVGQSGEWSRILNTTQEDRAKLCDILWGKWLFSALYGVYCLTLASLKAVLQNSMGRETETSQTNRLQSTEASADDTDGFQERKRKKKNITPEKSPPRSQPVTSVPT